MKIKAAFCAMLCLIFLLTACHTQNAPVSTDTTQSTTTLPENPTENTTEESSVPAPVLSQLPLLSVSLPVINETESAPNGDTFFNYIYQNISLVGAEPEVADKIIVDFLNRVDATSEDASRIAEEAKTAYTGDPAWSAYLCQYTFEPMRIDSGILSLFGSYATYNGTPHPEANHHAVTYSMVTGDVLTLTDILTDNASADALYSLVIDALKGQESSLYEGYEETVKDRFDNNFLMDKNWYLTDSSLCYYFAPYEIAGYASGVISAHIPYEKLIGIVDDTRFPAEQEIATGTIHATPFLDADLSQFNQFAEITLEENTSKILLFTEGSLRNIRLEIGSWNSDGSIFTPEYTLMALSSLTPGDAIMVEGAVVDKLPRLRIIYTSDNDICHEYITNELLNGK